MKYRVRHVFMQGTQDTPKDPNQWRVETVELMTEEAAVELVAIMNLDDRYGPTEAELLKK